MNEQRAYTPLMRRRTHNGSMSMLQREHCKKARERDGSSCYIEYVITNEFIGETHVHEHMCECVSACGYGLY